MPTRVALADLPDRYFFADPASGRRSPFLKKVRARSAIVGVATDHLERIFVLYAWADRCDAGRLSDEIRAVSVQYRPRVFGIEANAMQSLFADLVIRDAVRAQEELPLVPVHQKTTVDKDWRIRTAITPVINAGRLFIPAAFVELITELRSFPSGRTKDLVDALASAIALVPPRVARVQEESERDAELSYLRECGVAPEAIEQAAARWGLPRPFP